MIKLYIRLISIFSLVLFCISCDQILQESPQATNNSSIQKENTINSATLGGEEANIADYFYDFSNGVEAQYLYYSEPYYSGQSSSIINSNVLDVNQDTLNFRTFPDYLLDLTYDSLEVRGELFILNEKNSKASDWCNTLLLGECLPNSGDSIDFNDDEIFSDGMHDSYIIRDTTFSISYKNLDFMQWDSADGRYKTGLSAAVQLDSTRSYLPSTDTYDSLIYIGVIDTFYNPSYKPINSLVYVDRSEWNKFDTTYYTENMTHELSAKFKYSIQVLGSDSLIFRNNGDCDRNGLWTIAEPYYDYGRDFCPDSLESGVGKCTVVDLDEPGQNGYGSFLDEPPCNCLGSWQLTDMLSSESGQMEPHWTLTSPVSNNAIWDVAKNITTEEECLSLDIQGMGLVYWDDPEIPHCVYQQGLPDTGSSITCNLQCIYDPNGDNWRDCGLDGYCPDSSFDTQGNESGTERNGIWDLGEAMENNNKYDDEVYKGEYFVDRPNKFDDPAEYFYDSDPNDGIDGFAFGDSFEDRNCNGVWDDAENGEDKGNGIWDDNEKYQDINGDGQWESGEPLFTMNEAPDNFLVNYSLDYSSSCSENNIFDKCPSPFDKFVHPSLDAGATNEISIFSHYSSGGIPQFETYNNLLVSVEDSTTLKAVYKDIEKIVTVYTNEIIDSLPGLSSNYYITKTQWNRPNYFDNGLGQVLLLSSYDYDYHIFANSESGNIVKMMHPQYFNHYGYYDRYDINEIGDECSACFETGLWNQSLINEEVYIYAPNGRLRQGEYYYSEKDIILELAEYRLEEEFEVEFCDGDGHNDPWCSVDNNQEPISGIGKDEKIQIPAIKRTDPYSIVGANSVMCLADSLVKIDLDLTPEVLGESCSKDTTLQNIFKVTRTRTLTMLGNGLEFGSRNTIWLAKDFGIVKDKLEMRWSAGFWDVDNSTGEITEDWREFSRLELNKLQYKNISLMRKIMNPIRKVSYDSFDHIDSFNNDPFKNNNTIGLHRIPFSNE